MSPQIFLHIGAEKTGTTSIQTFFYANRALLRKQGVLYPTSPGIGNHIKLAAYAERPDKIDDLRKLLQLTDPQRVEEFRRLFQHQLAAEIDAMRPRKIVFSGEHCSSRLLQPGEVSDLARLLSGLGSQVKIILYLRRQDEFLLSTYSTAIKFGATQPLSLPNEQQKALRYDYQVLVDRWAAVFGRQNIVVRCFEKDGPANNSLYADICSLVGVEIDGEFEFPERKNVSLGAESLEFLRRINQHLPRFVGNAENPLRGNIVQIIEQRDREISTSRVISADQDLRTFLHAFQASNDALAREYCKQSGGLFPSLPLTAADEPSPDLTLEKAIRVMAILWQEKQAEVNQLRSVIEGLRQRLREEERAREGGAATGDYR